MWLLIILALSWLATPALAQAPPTAQCVSTAIAGGTGDALTIARLPCVPTTTLLVLTTTFANTTTTPTITPSGGPTLPIVNNDGSPMQVGELKAGARYVLTSSGQVWYLVSPSLSATSFAANNVVTPGQFKLPTDADDTNSIIAALATCKTVELQASVTYVISRPLPLCNGGNQQVFGHGGSVIQLAATYDVTQHTPCSATSDGATWRAVFYNINCGGAAHTFVDTNISFSNFTIDASLVTAPIGQTIAIFLRNVQFASVDKMTCIRFADCTAMLASQFTTITASLARSNINAGFDFWDSPLNATLALNTAFCDGPVTLGQFGFLFNASDTTATHDGNGSSYLSVGNKAIGCGDALFIDPLTAGGSITGVTVADFVADGTALGFGAKSGIAISGNVIGAQLSNIVVENLIDGAAINIGLGNGNYPKSVTVHGLEIINSSTLTIAQAPITVHEGGTAPGTDRVEGVSFAPVSYYASTPRFQYAIDADTTGQYIEGQFPTNGSVGLAKPYGGIVPNINNLNYVQVSLGACGVAPSVTGVSARGSVTIGSTATQTCTVLFPNLNVFALAPTCTITPANATPYAGVANIVSTTAGFNIHSSTDMQGKTFLWQCNPL